MRLFLNKSRKYVLGMDATPESLLLSLFMKKNGYDFIPVHVVLGDQETQGFLEKFSTEHGLNVQFLQPDDFIKQRKDSNEDVAAEENYVEEDEEEEENVRKNKQNYVPRHVEFQNKNLRNKILSIFAVRNGGNAVVLSHTLQDQAESFFVKVARGSGLRGLRGMQPVTRNNLGKRTIFFHRPLIKMSNQEILQNLREILGKDNLEPGKDFLEKKVVENTDHHYVRTRILPAFEARWDSFYHNIRTLFESLQGDSATILETLRPHRLVKADSMLKYSDSVLQTYIMNAFYELGDRMPPYGLVANFIRNIRNGENQISLHCGNLSVNYNKQGGTLEIVPSSDNIKAKQFLNPRNPKNQKNGEKGNNLDNRKDKSSSEGNVRKDQELIFRTQSNNKKNLNQISL